MTLFTKLRETFFSIFPIMAIVTLLSLTVAPLEKEVFFRFLFGGILVIIGLTLFLLGVDIGLIPIGEKLGSTLTEKKNIFLLLSVSFLVVSIVTVAEPDVQVLSDQIRLVSPGVSKWPLVLGISFGVGVFIVIGLCRIVFSWSLRKVLIISYVLLFFFAFLCPKELQGASFDSGGATTGPMTVPFIMALGLGVASVRSGGKSKEDSSFGLTGLSSIGPIMTVCVYGIVLNMMGSGGGELEEKAAEDFFLEVNSNLFIFFIYLPKVIHEVFFSFFPLVLMFVIFQFLFLKLPPLKARKVIKGLLYSFLGLILFLTGAEVGFMSAGKALGFSLMQVASENGGGWIFLILVVSFAFGAITVCAEPAVWVLTEQVESASGGNIRKSLMLVSLSLGVALSVVLCLLRFIFGFSLWAILIPGYFIALLLTFFCPPLFTGIAFDSGGVASGPMTTTFILSFTLGCSEASFSSSTAGAFGVIALVAMTPLISIQILGCVFRIKTRKKKEGAK